VIPALITRSELAGYVRSPRLAEVLISRGLRPLVVGTGRGGRQQLFRREAVDSALDALEAAGPVTLEDLELNQTMESIIRES
jgi:hypothetical protein